MFAGERNGNPFQYSCLENPRDGGAWWPAVYGVTQSSRSHDLAAAVAGNVLQVLSYFQKSCIYIMDDI